MFDLRSNTCSCIRIGDYGETSNIYLKTSRRETDYLGRLLLEKLLKRRKLFRLLYLTSEKRDLTRAIFANVLDDPFVPNILLNCVYDPHHLDEVALQLFVETPLLPLFSYEIAPRNLRHALDGRLAQSTIPATLIGNWEIAGIRSRDVSQSAGITVIGHLKLPERKVTFVLVRRAHLAKCST